eukprot:CAMPEP_0114995644 /NCGR_PEP_ID=MMETSP0216-20121206/13849_1 /TAXON_ID=223996 /ORGANISM="Protocruzia adherens, Strain Boccale" /LENGTH=357 /DNA_ID=CAMNT_0002359719 /DNA_START=405 /DNA_END=1478 /DNA_ORIENTATION=+
MKDRSELSQSVPLTPRMRKNKSPPRLIPIDGMDKKEMSQIQSTSIGEDSVKFESLSQDQMSGGNIFKNVDENVIISRDPKFRRSVDAKAAEKRLVKRRIKSSSRSNNSFASGGSSTMMDDLRRIYDVETPTNNSSLLGIHPDHKVALTMTNRDMSKETTSEKYLALAEDLQEAKDLLEKKAEDFNIIQQQHLEEMAILRESFTEETEGLYVIISNLTEEMSHYRLESSSLAREVDRLSSQLRQLHFKTKSAIQNCEIKINLLQETLSKKNREIRELTKLTKDQKILLDTMQDHPKKGDLVKKRFNELSVIDSNMEEYMTDSLRRKYFDLKNELAIYKMKIKKYEEIKVEKSFLRTSF